MKSKKIKATVQFKKIIIEKIVAITESGQEMEIRGIRKNKLKHGMELKGVICEEQIQDKYSDGSYARSFTTNMWFQADEIKNIKPEMGRKK